MTEEARRAPDYGELVRPRAFVPAQQSPRDPHDPATWAAAVGCPGTDGHPLSVTPRHLAPMALAGAVVAALDARTQLYGRGLGTALGLALTPLIAALFARQVQGPLLTYRTWGRKRTLRLDTVTAVTAGRPTIGATSIVLHAPSLARPLRLSLSNRGYYMPPAVRDHLRGWLTGPGVDWSPQAAELFDGHGGPATTSTRRRHRLLALAAGVVLPIAGAAVVFLVALHSAPPRAIPGAAGYFRFGGPHGKLLAVGRPWGQECEPVRLAVAAEAPDWAYTQVAAAVDEARQDGLDVALESRSFTWDPQSLTYGPGQSPATVPRVPVLWRTDRPPTVSGGKAERLGLGWDAALDADGAHEHLTSVQGVLWSQSLAGQPRAVRTSVRALIALTQGVLRTTRQDSGLLRDAATDAFSSADVAAMRRMSGCGRSG